MSADEDTELRDLVAQTLESNGVLGKFRAQLRVCVFQALEEQDIQGNYTNVLLKKLLGTKEGRLITGLVREFLEFFSLDYTLAVFDPEVGITKDQYGSRGELARELDIEDKSSESNLPLISKIFHRSSQGDLDSRHESSVEVNTNNLHSGAIKSTTSKLPRKNGHLNLQIEKSHDFSKSQSKQQNSPRNLEDDFFDDPLSNSDHPKPLASDSVRSGQDVMHADKPFTTKSTGVSSLAGLPSLSQSDSRKTSGFNDFDDMKDIDKKIADLGVEMPNDYDYDDDFESSNISALGPTPRSARSDYQVKSIEEDIEEYIEISGAEDLLKSDNSAADDLTTDRSVSPTDQSAAIDYMENVMSL